MTAKPDQPPLPARRAKLRKPVSEPILSQTATGQDTNPRAGALPHREDAAPRTEAPHIRALIAEQAEMIAAQQQRLLDEEAKLTGAMEVLADRDALLEQLRLADIRHLRDLTRTERLSADNMVLQAALRAVVASADQDITLAQTTV